MIDRIDVIESPQRWRLTLIICSVLAVSSSAPGIMGPLLTSISRDLRVDVEKTGALVSVQYLGYAFAVLAAGYLADKFGKRRIILAGQLTLVASMVMIGLLKLWPLLTLAQIFVGLVLQL